MIDKNQKVKIRVIKQTFEYYKSKGYDVQINKSCEINIEDLSDSSDKEINVICDYCGKSFTKIFKKYKKQREHVEKDCCYDCFPLKQKDVIIEKYGVESTLCLEENKEKSKNTLKEKYGENITNSMQVESVKVKAKETMMKNYGVEHALQSKELKEKCKNTLIEKYGVPNPQSKYKYDYEYVNSKKVSKPQRKIAEYLNADLNINIGGFFADMVIDNIIIEYDGGGHDLSVQLGKITQDDFNDRTDRKDLIFKESGYVLLKIFNLKDKYINKKILEDIKEFVKNSEKENSFIYIIE